MARLKELMLLLFATLLVPGFCDKKNGNSEPKSDGDTSSFLNQDSCFCEIDTGKLEDCSCTTEKISHFNTEIHDKLVKVLHGDYFRYFQVNFNKECKFWNDRDGQCGSQDCAVDTCPAHSLPDHVRDHKDDFHRKEPESEPVLHEHTIYECLQDKYHEFLPMIEPLVVLWHDFPSSYLPGYLQPAQPCLQDPLPQYSKVDTSLTGAPVDLINQFCTLDPFESTEGCNYIDLVKNEEKYTGYQGKSANRIWGKIYGDLCFTPKESSSVSDLCLEEKTLYRIISGLHSSITVHLCSNYLLERENPLMGRPAVWGRNVQEFQRRYDPKLTGKKGPEWLKNMFYLYLIELRALGKAGSILRSQDFMDSQISSQVEEIVQSAQQFQYHFDENDLFKSDELKKGELFSEFKQKFREISHLMDCMGCERCKVWGKLQVTGIGTALKILFTPLEELRLTRHEVVALVNAFGRVSTSLIELEKFRD
jgi:ERO1-like protein alpha